MTAGIGVERKRAQFDADHDEYSSIMLETLADRLAEAHRAVRLRAAESLSNDELIAERYPASAPRRAIPHVPSTAPSATCSACSRCGRGGIELTDSLAKSARRQRPRLPARAPESRYSNVGRIGDDPLAD